MGVRTIGVLMNGVTGRMGTNQHLIRSILAIRADGGIALPDGDRLQPEPILLGRNERKVRDLAAAHGIERWSTSLEASLEDSEAEIYFDAQITERRGEAVRRAIEAGKHIYCEKPLAGNLQTARSLTALARECGVKNGVVQDKLFLPGPRKLRSLVEAGFFGRLLSIRGEFGYWVFDGHRGTPQRPSWNYRREEGGGIILDMFPHWTYLFEGLFGPVRSLSCLGDTHIHERVDENGEPYMVTADDAAYATLLLDGGIVTQMNSSWCVRVYRDDLLFLQVDGTDGSAVAGLHSCHVQEASATPGVAWDPDVPGRADYRSDWRALPDSGPSESAFKLQWEAFLRHVALDEPFPWDFASAARGVQLAELALRSWEERRWVEVPDLSLT